MAGLLRGPTGKLLRGPGGALTRDPDCCCDVEIPTDCAGFETYIESLGATKKWEWRKNGSAFLRPDFLWNGSDWRATVTAEGQSNCVYSIGLGCTGVADGFADLNVHGVSGTNASFNEWEEEDVLLSDILSGAWITLPWIGFDTDWSGSACNSYNDPDAIDVRFVDS